jgi:hypothetical protein
VTTTRKTRHTRDELRELLLEKGRAILGEEGLGTGAEALTFKRVFDRVEQDTGIRLTNASVIRRVWENQAEFQVDVLVAIAMGDYDGDVSDALAYVRPVLASVDRSSPESRAEAMREICRVGGAVSARALRQSSNLPSWIGVWALAASGESLEYRKKIEEALLSGYETFTERVEHMYSALTSYLGFRLREGLTLHQFVIASDSLSQGYGLRDRIDNSVMETIVRATGPDGESQEWTIFGVAFEGLVRQFFEIDPEWSVG